MVRFKNRYLLVDFVFPRSSQFLGPEAEPPPHFSEGTLIQLLRSSLRVNFGDLGAGLSGNAFSVMYFSQQTHVAILRVSRENVKHIWASLSLLRKVQGHDVIVRVVHVSGTVKKLQRRAILHDRHLLSVLPVSARVSTEELQALSQEAIMGLQ